MRRIALRRMVIAGLHAGYWLMYLSLVLVMMILAARTVHFPRRMVPFMGAVFFLPALSAFYTFYFGLFGSLLQRKRLVLLGIAIILVSLACGVFSLLTMRLFFGPRIQVTWTMDTAGEVLVSAFVAFANGILALVIKGFIIWYGDIRVKEELRRKNTEMELALLRSQLSPHFLFNTLNNIDVLIEKDAARASGYLQQLSGILRFMLYEVRAEKVPLDAELHTIEKYISLQKIRTANPDSIQYTVEGEPGRWMIEPMLFLPFIENAFKHGEKKAENAIRIRFQLDDAAIRFHCENRYVRKPAGSTNPNSGLGDSLIRKRLLLLYPGRHTLEVQAGSETYKTTLTLTGHAN